MVRAPVVPLHDEHQNHDEHQERYHPMTIRPLSSPCRARMQQWATATRTHKPPPLLDECGSGRTKWTFGCDTQTR